jgi:hypothetical protein
MGLRKINVAIPQGDIYPNGLRLVPADPNIQATVRPEGSFFQKSAGYESIRPGRNRYQKAYHGMGIHFTPMRFAEDVGEFDSLPLLVDAKTAAMHADIAELPGSERLDDEGALTAEDVNANEGVKMAETSTAAPAGDEVMHRGNRTVADMGDREPGRPLTRDYYGMLRNPVGVFRDEYSENPLMAVGVAGLIVGGIYYVARELERNMRSRSQVAAAGGGVTAVAAPVAAAPAAAADTAGGAVRDATAVVNEAATAAGQAAETAASAAGDAAEAAGKAVEQVTDAAADAATGDN